MRRVDDWVDVTLRLMPGTDVPRGEIVVLGVTTGFHGWMELLRQLEQVRDGAGAGVTSRDSGT